MYHLNTISQAQTFLMGSDSGTGCSVKVGMEVVIFFLSYCDVYPSDTASRTRQDLILSIWN